MFMKENAKAPPAGCGEELLLCMYVGILFYINISLFLCNINNITYYIIKTKRGKY